jgi:hypothetical protein
VVLDLLYRHWSHADFLGQSNLRQSENFSNRSYDVQFGTVLEALCAWLYLLIETDVAPIPLWRKAVVQWPLPIVAIYESGGSGDHVLLRINAQSKEDFDRKSAQYDPELIRLGACPGSVTARRLSRLPNCMRGQTGRLQRLLYLRPDADGTPICKIPPRLWTPGVYHNYESPDL